MSPWELVLGIALNTWHWVTSTPEWVWVTLVTLALAGVIIHTDVHDQQ